MCVCAEEESGGKEERNALYSLQHVSLEKKIRMGTRTKEKENLDRLVLYWTEMAKKGIGDVPAIVFLSRDNINRKRGKKDEVGGGTLPRKYSMARSREI